MHFEPAPPEALPTETFADRRSVDVNGEQIILAYVPPAHTDTDIMVHFTKANVLHMGDLFFNGTYPFIDASTRGNINGMIGGAARALQMADDRTKIVPGHGPARRSRRAAEVPDDDADDSRPRSGPEDEGGVARAGPGVESRRRSSTPAGGRA